MALSGSFGGKTASKYIKPIITWSAVQSEEGNYSDITATLTYSRTNRGYTTQGTWEGALTIGGQTFPGEQALKITYESHTVAITATARVQHDTYGARTVDISATGKIGGTSLTDTTISAQVTLDEIPQSSTLSASDGAVGSCVTVVVHRKHAQYSHSIAYCFGELSGYIDQKGDSCQEPVRLTETVVNFRLPEVFYQQFPDKSREVCTLTCTTYRDEQVLGTPQTSQFQVYADEKQCSPWLFFQAQDVAPDTLALTGESSVIVRYLSTIRCRLSASARNGAWITGQSILGVEGAQLDIPGPEHGQVTFSATDSRGYTVTENLVIPLIPYVPLSVNAQIRRVSPTSNRAIVSMQGSCWKGNFGQKENFLCVTLQVEGGTDVTVFPEVSEDHTYQLDVPLNDLDYTRSYRITVAVSDAVRTVRQIVTVQKGVPVFDWGETDFCFHVPVDVPALTLGGVSLKEYIQSTLKEIQDE